MPIVRSKHSFDQHFTQIPNAWVRDSRISLKAKGLLAQLMSHQPGWKVSVKSLAEANSCGLDTIRSAVSELMEAGYLERSESRERDEKGQLGDYNYVTKDPEVPTSENPTLENPTLDNSTPKKTIDKEDYREEVNPQGELEVAFEEFWNIYPRKVEKIAARKAFIKAATSYGVETVLDGARRLAKDPYLPPKQYVPYPASWLNAGGWDSEPYPPRQLTPEEIQARNRADAEARRLKEAEWNRRLRAEWEEAERKASSPPKCEHGNSIVSCRQCLRNYVG